MDRKRVVIVGGGITGLAAAYYLQEQTQKNDQLYDVTVLEASDQLGGKLDTIQQDGYIAERGPDSILARKRPGIRLMENLGLTDRLIYNQTGQSYVLVDDALHHIPGGSYMGLPVSEEPFLNSGIISAAGKNQVLAEVDIPRGDTASDQSLGHFLRRRFGDELVENLLEPLLSGIYSSDVDKMSLMSTFPYFYELEQQYGSVLKGLRETMPAKRQGTGKKPSQFVTLPQGLQEIVSELKNTIDGETIRTGENVQHIDEKQDGYVLYTADGSSFAADTILLTIPHQHVPTLFDRHDLVDPLLDIPVSSVATVSVGFDAKAVENHLDGTGFVVSRNSDFRITACTWASRKWPHTTPDGKMLFRLHVGKPNDQDVVDLSDEAIIRVVLHDLRKVMKIDGAPEFARVSRWRNVMPQYTLGHEQAISQVRQYLHDYMPGVYIAGASYDGVGLPDCIGSAEKAVHDILSDV